MCTHGSGLWDMARLWLRYHHSLSLASSSRQLCTAVCMPWRVMTAPNRGLGSHTDLRDTHQHCSPLPYTDRTQPSSRAAWSTHPLYMLRKSWRLNWFTTLPICCR